MGEGQGDMKAERREAERALAAARTAAVGSSVIVERTGERAVVKKTGNGFATLRTSNGQTIKKRAHELVPDDGRAAPAPAAAAAAAAADANGKPADSKVSAQPEAAEGERVPRLEMKLTVEDDQPIVSSTWSLELRDEESASADA